MRRCALLPTSWIYDARTRTLFTSDLFSYVIRAPTPEGPWVTHNGR